jgi:radical SAM protein with 4Fe4S-binding SPASM domain
MMKMCLLLREPEFDLRKMPFQQIWNEMFPPVYSQLRSAEHPCNSCNIIALCGKCPAWSQMEKGDMEARVEYSCEVGHRRAKALGHWDGVVDQYAKTMPGAGDEVTLPVLQAAGECCQ